MTIAAGFFHTDGVLLCSDSQLEGAATKFQGPKIGVVDVSAGKMAFAISGHVSFAIAAVQSLAALLRNVDGENFASELKSIHEKEYRRVVFDHPDYKTNHDLGYSILISFWSRLTSQVSLFLTDDHSVHACYGSECIGIGFELANVITRPFFGEVLSERDTLILAAYTLAQVKTNVPGCGLESMFISMRHDGTVTPVVNIVTDQIEQVSAPYHKAVHSLLFAMGGDDDDRLSAELEGFCQRSRAISATWRSIKESNQAVSQYRR